MGQSVRLRDVAAHAGVSPATASRTLNGDEAVAAELRDRVYAAVEFLKYRPNMLARNLRLQRLDAVGVVVSDIQNPHFSEMVKVTEEQCFSLGYRVLVCSTDESRQKQATYLRMLGDQRVSGVIISPSDPAAPEISDLIQSGIPVVAFDRDVADSRADTVVADNVQGLAAATQFLIGLGHTSIAFVGGPASVETSVHRLRGYRQAMRSAGLRRRSVVGDFGIEGGRRAVASLLSSATPPTALVVANNLMTLGSLKAANDAHVDIPGDLALVGVDDPYWAEFVHPSITSMAQPVAAMARESVGMIVARIHGEAGPPRRSVHSLGLIVRASSGSGPGVVLSGGAAGQPSAAAWP